MEDLLNLPTYSKSGSGGGGPSKRAQSGLLLRPISKPTPEARQRAACVSVF